MRDNIVFLDAGTVDFRDISWAAFEKLGIFKIFHHTAPRDIPRRIAGARIVITNKCRFDFRVFSQARDLACLCVAATGTNNVDLEAARRAGVSVRNVAGYSTESVVQLTFAFLLALACGLRGLDRSARDGTWSRSPFFTLAGNPIMEVSGKTLGIVGYGAIGKRVARVARAFGMRIAVARIPGKKYPSRDAVSRIPLHRLVAQADFLTLHCPLSPLTRGLINGKLLAKMKPGAFVINMARGEVVDESALAKALRRGHLAGAASDVLSEEPPRTNHPLLTAPRMLLTPHVAWASREARRRLVAEIAQNIEAFQRGRTRNSVT